jgi:hypothetical protein
MIDAQFIIFGILYMLANVDLLDDCDTDFDGGALGDDVEA